MQMCNNSRYFTYFLFYFHSPTGLFVGSFVLLPVVYLIDWSLEIGKVEVEKLLYAGYVTCLQEFRGTTLLFSHGSKIKPEKVQISKTLLIDVYKRIGINYLIHTSMCFRL